MRLIDAEELKRELKIWCYNRTTTTPTFSFVTEKDIDDMPTVCDLEQIRAEIENEIECYDDKVDFHRGVRVGLNIAVQIIDKYKAESEDKE